MRFAQMAVELPTCPLCRWYSAVWFAKAKLTVTAKFVVNVRGYTVDDDDMVCLDLVVDFVS